MPALPFNKQFVGKVESGEKRQTIRKRRKRPIKAGDRLSFFTGWRTKKCRKFGHGVCKQTFAVRRVKRGQWECEAPPGWANDSYSETGILYLALADGFDSVDAFEDWFDAHCGPNELLDVIRW